VIAVTCVAIGMVTRKALFGIFLYLMASYGLLFGLVQAPAPDKGDICFKLNQTISVQAHIEEGLGLKTSLVKELVCDGHELACNSSIYPNKIHAGKHIFASAKVESLRGRSLNSIGRYLKNGVFSRLRLEQVKETSECSKDIPVFVQMRKCMVERHEEILGKVNGALLASIVLGDKVVDLPSSVKSDFRRSGVSHLLAASGFNLSIFVTAMCLCLRLITRYSAIISVAGIIAVISFVLLAGPSPSVVRAAIWAVLLLLLKLADRRINLFALLAFSMFLHLVIDPFSILDIGWQLSYAATASIICGVENMIDKENEQKFSILKSIFKWFRTASVVVLMAQAAVLPLACLYFKQINAMFLVVNLMLDPLVAPLTILGFISSWVSLAGRDVAWCLDILAYYPLEYMLWVTNFFSRVEISQISIKPPPTWILCEYSIAFIYFVYAKQGLKRDFKYASLVFFLSLLLLLLSSICRP
jgi:competence protein ComEC